MLSSDRNASSRRRSKQKLTPTGCVTPYSLGHARHQSTMISATSQIASRIGPSRGARWFSAMGSGVGRVAPAAMPEADTKYRAISARPNSRRFKNQAVCVCGRFGAERFNRGTRDAADKVAGYRHPSHTNAAPLKVAWGEGGRRRVSGAVAVEARRPWSWRRVRRPLL